MLSFKVSHKETIMDFHLCVLSTKFQLREWKFLFFVIQTSSVEVIPSLRLAKNLWHQERQRVVDSAANVYDIGNVKRQCYWGKKTGRIAGYLDLRQEKKKKKQCKKKKKIIDFQWRVHQRPTNIFSWNFWFVCDVLVCMLYIYRNSTFRPNIMMKDEYSHRGTCLKI